MSLRAQVLWPAGWIRPWARWCGTRCFSTVCQTAAGKAVCGWGDWSLWWSCWPSSHTAGCKNPQWRAAPFWWCDKQFSPEPYGWEQWCSPSWYSQLRICRVSWSPCWEESLGCCFCDEVSVVGQGQILTNVDLKESHWWWWCYVLLPATSCRSQSTP